MANIHDLHKVLEHFELQPESAGYDLRLSFAELLLRRLDELGWSQKQLAEASGMKAPQLSRIIHSDQNCTFDVAGRLLFALGLRARISEKPPTPRVKEESTTAHIVLKAQVNTHGKETPTTRFSVIATVEHPIGTVRNDPRTDRAEFRRPA